MAALGMVLAILTYQSTIALFVILSIPLAMKNAENFKKYIFNGIAIGVVFVIPAIVSLFAFKFIFKSARFVESADYYSKFVGVIYNIFPFAANSVNILPRFLFLLITLVTFAAAIVWAATCQRKIWRIFNVCVIVGAGCLCSTASIIQGSGWWSARTLYPLASIPAGLAIDLFVNKEEVPVNESVKKWVRNISAAALVVLMIGQYFSFNKIYINKYRLNALDQYRYQYIGQAIREYQDDTGMEIKKVAFYTDAELYSPQPSNQFQLRSAFTADWSDFTAMNYYLHTSYKKIDPVEEYIEYFASKDWDTLSKDQLIFDGDTLHICVY